MKRKIYGYLFVWCLAMALSVGWGMRPAHGATEPGKGDRYYMNGVFVQLDHRIAGWSEKKWEEEFQRMKRLGFRELIVQWCRHDDTKYYSGIPTMEGKADKGQAEGKRHVIGIIIELSKRFGMDLYLGLYHDSAYWSQIKGPAHVVENYLYYLIDKNLAVANGLMPLISEFPGFKGFYIPQEVDDVTWSKREYAKKLKYFINTLSNRLRQLHPGSKVLMSTFFRGRTSPRYFARLWKKFSSEDALDVVMIQDGMGTGKVTLQIMERYFTEISRTLKDTGVEVWSIVEVFDALEGDEQDFTAKSASLERVKTQMSIAGTMVDNQVAFSLRYFSPYSETPGAEQLLDDYLDFFTSSGLP